MAHRKFDGVQQLATGTGTAALTLGSATKPFYRTMQAAGAINGDTLTVRIQHETIEAEWEEVRATYSAGAITRTFDSNSSSATGALIAFSAGNKIVSNVLRAGDAVAMDNNGDAAVTRDVAIGRNATVGGTLGVTGAITSAAKIKSTLSGTWGFAVDSAAGTNRFLSFLSAGVSRFDIGISNTPESGSDVGSDLFINTLTDAGVYKNTPIVIKRSTGYIGVFKSLPTVPFDVAGSISSSGTLTSNNLIVQGDGTHGYIRPTNASSSLYLGSNNTNQLVIGALGDIYSVGDNTQKLGTASNRWSTVYAGTGTINTSDAREKTNIRSLTDADIRVGRRLSGLVRLWQFNDAIAMKGEAGARFHTGWVAQDVVAAFVAEGADPFRHACVGFDLLDKVETFEESVARPKMREVADFESGVEIIDGTPRMVRKSVTRQEPVGQQLPVLDEAGQPIMVDAGQHDEQDQPLMTALLHFVPEMEEVLEQRTRVVPDVDENGEQRQRLNVRPDQLIAFVIASLDARLTALEAA